MTFLDTNIAVCAADSHDPLRHAIAAELVDSAVGEEV